MKLMSKVGAFLAFTVPSLLPGFAHGQIVKGQVLVGPVGGIVLPLGEMKWEAKAGFHAGITAEKMISNNFSVGGDFAYTRFGTARHMMPLGGDTALDVSTWRLFQLGAHGTFFFTSSWPLNPFVRAGAGVYLTRVDYADELAGGFSLGAGVACQVSRRVRGTLEAAYNRFDRLNDLVYGVFPYFYPALKYWSLNFALAYQVGPK